jgi:ribosomal protein S18 acetylase RimI-like enzyme
VAQPADQTLTWDVHDDVPQEAGQVVDDGLGEANDAAAPLHEVRPLSCFARTPAGAVIGGAVGRSWGQNCELQQIWVDAAFRDAGVGSELLRRFETHAMARGCRSFYLDTWSFQARGFYEGLGYRVVLEIGGFPHGIIKYTMMRQVVL